MRRSEALANFSSTADPAVRLAESAVFTLFESPES